MFPLFTSLPPELRARIWELSVGPREVDIKINTRKARIPATTSGMTSSSPTPAPLHACREAREHLYTFCGYQRLTYWGYNQRVQLFPAPDPVADKGYPIRMPYVWLNLDRDMINIGQFCIKHFRKIGHLVRNLSLDRYVLLDDMATYEAEKRQYKKVFPNVDVVHIFCPESIEAWAVCGLRGLADDWACPPENLILEDIDPCGRGEHRFLPAVTLENSMNEAGMDGSEEESETNDGEEEL